MNIYRTALQVQDASNPNGVINTLANEIMPAIRNEAGYREQGTAYLSTHPVLILFLDKLASMTGHWLSGDDLSDYWQDCTTKAEGLEAVEAAKLPGGPLDTRDRERDSILAQRDAERHCHGPNWHDGSCTHQADRQAGR